MGARQYVQREWRLLSWWLATFHPHADISMQVRLGPPARAGGLVPIDEAELELVRVRNRWADAVLVEQGELFLVEAKIEPDPGIFSTLIHYARKLRADPDWRAYERSPLHLVAVVYNDDPSVAVEAPWYGVSWEVFRPNLAEMPAARVEGAPLSTFDSRVPLPHDWPARLRSWGIVALGGM